VLSEIMFVKGPRRNEKMDGGILEKMTDDFDDENTSLGQNCEGLVLL
jgi:hypothetical protein